MRRIETETLESMRGYLGRRDVVEELARGVTYKAETLAAEGKFNAEAMRPVIFADFHTLSVTAVLGYFDRSGNGEQITWRASPPRLCQVLGGLATARAGLRTFLSTMREALPGDVYTLVAEQVDAVKVDSGYDTTDGKASLRITAGAEPIPSIQFEVASGDGFTTIKVDLAIQAEVRALALSFGLVVDMSTSSPYDVDGFRGHVEKSKLAEVGTVVHGQAGDLRQELGAAPYRSADRAFDMTPRTWTLKGIPGRILPARLGGS